MGVYSLRVGIAEKANASVLGLGSGGCGLGIARRLIKRTSCYERWGAGVEYHFQKN